VRTVIKAVTYRVLGVGFGFWLGTMFHIPPSVNFYFNVVSNIVASFVYYGHEKIYDRFWKRKA